MSTAAVNTYKGKIDRGTMTLAQIDAAEKGKLVTAAEATTLRTYWHSVYDVVGLAVAAAADRSQTVTWTAPTSIHNLELTRSVDGGAGAPVLTPSSSGHYTFGDDVGEAEVAISVRAVVSNAVNGFQGGEATASTTVPAYVAPEPTPEPEAPAAEAPAESGEQAPAEAASTGKDTPAADA